MPMPMPSPVTEILQTCPQQVRSSGPRQGVGQHTQDPVSPTSQGTSASEKPHSQPPGHNEHFRDVGMKSLPAMTKQEIHVGQKEDPVIGPVLHYKSLNQKPSRS